MTGTTGTERPWHAWYQRFAPSSPEVYALQVLEPVELAEWAIKLRQEFPTVPPNGIEMCHARWLETIDRLIEDIGDAKFSRRAHWCGDIPPETIAGLGLRRRVLQAWLKNTPREELLQDLAEGLGRPPDIGDLLYDLLGEMRSASQAVRQDIEVLADMFSGPFEAGNAPIMAKYALELNLKVGTTVGSIYAVSSLGSILGTFLAGFVLIPSFDIRIIIFIVSLVIASLSFLVIGKKLVTVGVMAAIVVLFLVFQTTDPDGLIGTGDDEILYSRHSQHAHIQVKDFKTGDRVDVRTLIMNGLQHNRHDPANPDNLLYEYERIFGAVTEYYISTMRDPSSFTALTLGGGAMTFPAYMERRWDPERNSVVEIDPRVVELAFEYFDVPRDTEMNIVVADARAYVNTVRDERTYDLIYLDAFSSFSIPYHLTTRQFAEELDRILVPDGVIMANVIDIFSIGRFLNAYHNTLAAVFPHVRVYSGPALPTTTRSTFVIVASRTPIIPDSIRDARGAPVASTISDEMLADLVERNGPLVLTDTYSPVENLIAPVFLRAIN